MAATSIILALPLALDQAGLHVPWAFFPVAGLFQMLWTTFHFQPGVDGVPTLIVTALCQVLFFWMAAALVFSRRDVTISPE
jgi:hypothetical protein